MTDTPRKGRRGRGPTMITIYWRDIPAQVNVKGTDAKRLMPPRFQVAIDRAAMIADMSDTDSYVQQWRQVTKPVSGDPLELAMAEAERLDIEYTSERLNAIVQAGGTDTALSEDSAAHTDREQA